MEILLSNIISERMTATLDGDFVVFLIGLRVNKPWKIHKWWPAAMAMPKMIKELEAQPESGFLGHTSGSKVSIQYWRSFKHLDAYAKNKNAAHLPAWRAFNRSIAKNRGDVGIWHETYLINAGAYETIYSGMPPFGLGKAGTLTPAVGSKESAKGRITGDSTL